MGIKGWLTVGGVVLTGIAVLLGIKKKEDEHNERIQYLIREVDGKEPKKEEAKAVEEIEVDVNDAMSGMDIDGDDEITPVTDEKADDILKKGNEVLKKANEMLNDSETNRKEEQRIVDNLNKIREDRLQNGEWLKDVQEAAKIKNFSQLETLLNEKYNPYPYHPAPSDPYGQGYHEGVIDEKTYKAAQKYYDRLWNYSGD